MNWAKAECIRRNGKDLGKTDPMAMRGVLGEALSLIRDYTYGVTAEYLTNEIISLPLKIILLNTTFELQEI